MKGTMGRCVCGERVWKPIPSAQRLKQWQRNAGKIPHSFPSIPRGGMLLCLFWADMQYYRSYAVIWYRCVRISHLPLRHSERCIDECFAILCVVSKCNMNMENMEWDLKTAAEGFQSTWTTLRKVHKIRIRCTVREFYVLIFHRCFVCNLM